MIDLSKPLFGIWYVVLPKGDWLGTMWHENGERRYVYRFRYYSHANPGAPNAPDPKTWYEGRGPAGTVADDFAMFSSGVTAMAASVAETVQLIDMRDARDADERSARVLKAPWAHPSITAAGGIG